MEVIPSPQECLRKAIDDEIKSLEGSIRALKHSRNKLAPISSLPTEVVEAIFSLLRVPGTSPSSTLGGKPVWLLRVTHVCQHWRKIALNQPLLWSHLNFATVSSAGAAEILTRAKTVPLHLEAQVPLGRWGDTRFRNLRKELKAHVSHIRHLDLNIEFKQLNKTLDRLTLAAPTLGYLSLSCQEGYIEKVSIPNTLFNGTTPGLSCLELYSCIIYWKSPLLRGLEHLKIRATYPRPILSDWLNAMDEMPQLKTLILDWASPVTPPNSPRQFNIERTITLPFLTLFDIGSHVRGCGLALHLILPALTTLCIKAETDEEGSDLPLLLPYLTQYTYGLHQTQPLQSTFVRNDKKCVEILAWTFPDIDLYDKLSHVNVEYPEKIDTFYPKHSLQVAIFGDVDWTPETHPAIFDMLMPAFLFDGIVTLAVDKRRTRLDKQFWLRHAPQWHLVQCMQLGSRAASGLREMLLEDNEGRESPLFPLLTKLVLFDSSLSAPRTLRLCEALVNRVEQGVPLETLDLRRCFATRRAVKLLSEIVSEVLGPEGSFKEKAQARSRWDPTARGLFVGNDSSGEDVDDTDSGSDGEMQVVEETDDGSNDWEAEFMLSLMDEVTD